LIFQHCIGYEIAIISENLDIDAVEIIEVAKFHTKLNIHTPGPWG
jgi:UDP-N-acetyl-D-mannosaminuronate dehydrogenase